MNNIKFTAFSGTKNNKFTERNTNTIKNNNLRKLTSIALMTIMVAGGLTFAIPGMEPAQAQNPHLKVSAEGQADNVIGITNIVEVVVIDDFNSDAGDAPPEVTVDGSDLIMSRAGETGGAWYGYFADVDITDTGLTGTCVDIDTDGSGTCPTENLVSSTHGAAAVYTYDLDGDFDIIYQRPGGDQTVTLTADDPSSDAGLDRNSYPQNTEVEISIDDLALNVDPTSVDSWTFTTAEDGTQTITRNVGDTPQTATDGVEAFSIDTHNQGSNPLITGGNVDEVTFEEDGRNTSVFLNNDFRTTDEAPRGLSFSVTYDSTATSSVGFSTANIVIDAGDQWSSGEEIGITLTDGDANTSTLDANDLDVSDPNHIIPTIAVGEPHTLANGISAAISQTGLDDADDTALTDGHFSMTSTDDGSSQRVVVNSNVTATYATDDTITLDLTYTSIHSDDYNRLV